MCLLLSMPALGLVLLSGSIHSRSVSKLLIVRVSGHGTQQCEECHSIAKEHQETRCRDLFQRWHLQDLCLWIRLVWGREGFCFQLLSGCRAYRWIFWTFPQILRLMNGAKYSRWSVWGHGSMTSASESPTYLLLGLRENRVVCKENSLLCSSTELCCPCVIKHKILSLCRLFEIIKNV